MRFRKRPVEVEAVQYGNNEYADGGYEFVGEGPVPQWLRDAVENGTLSARFAGEDYWYLDVRTLEGVMTAAPGDWIIRGVKGELYPCKPDIFAATYERVEQVTIRNTAECGCVTDGGMKLVEACMAHQELSGGE